MMRSEKFRCAGLGDTLFRVRVFECATAECVATGANLDANDPGTQAFLKASDAKVFSDIGTAATVVSGITPVGAIGRSAGIISDLATGGKVILTGSWHPRFLPRTTPHRPGDQYHADGYAEQPGAGQPGQPDLHHRLPERQRQRLASFPICRHLAPPTQMPQHGHNRTMDPVPAPPSDQPFRSGCLRNSRGNHRPWHGAP